MEQGGSIDASAVARESLAGSAHGLGAIDRLLAIVKMPREEAARGGRTGGEARSSWGRFPTQRRPVGPGPRLPRPKRRSGQRQEAAPGLCRRSEAAQIKGLGLGVGAAEQLSSSSGRPRGGGHAGGQTRSASSQGAAAKASVSGLGAGAGTARPRGASGRAEALPALEAAVVQPASLEVGARPAEPEQALNPHAEEFRPGALVPSCQEGMWCEAFALGFGQSHGERLRQAVWASPQPQHGVFTAGDDDDLPAVVLGQRESEYLGLQALAEIGDWVVLCQVDVDVDGFPFYWNRRTGEKSWEAPLSVKVLEAEETLLRWSAKVRERKKRPGLEARRECLCSSSSSQAGRSCSPDEPWREEGECFLGEAESLNRCSWIPTAFAAVHSGDGAWDEAVQQSLYPPDVDPYIGFHWTAESGMIYDAVSAAYGDMEPGCFDKCCWPTTLDCPTSIPDNETRCCL